MDDSPSESRRTCNLEVRVDEGSTLCEGPESFRILVELNCELMVRSLPAAGASVAERNILRSACPLTFDYVAPANPVGRLSGELCARGIFTVAEAESYIERIRCLRPHGRSGRIVVGIDGDRQVIPLDGRDVRRIVTVRCEARSEGELLDSAGFAARIAEGAWGAPAEIRMVEAFEEPRCRAAAEISLDWDGLFPYRHAQHTDIVQADGFSLRVYPDEIIAEREEE